MPRRWREQGEEFKVTLSYMVSSRLSLRYIIFLAQDGNGILEAGTKVAFQNTKNEEVERKLKQLAEAYGALSDAKGHLSQQR